MQQQQMQMQAAMVPPVAAPVAGEERAAAPVEDVQEPIQTESSNPVASSQEETRDQAEVDEAESLDEIVNDRDVCEQEEVALANSTSEEEEESMVSEEEEEETSLNTADTDEEGTKQTMSYDEEGTCDGNEAEVKAPRSYDGSLAACEAVGNQKKFFHKDVVLHNMNEHNAGNDLVVRAMYFVPKPKNPNDVVVRIEVSWNIDS